MSRHLFLRSRNRTGIELGCGRIWADAESTIRFTDGEWQPLMSKNGPHHVIASHVLTEAFALVVVEVEYGFSPWKRVMKLA